MSDSIKIMYLAKESNLEYQAIIDEVKELGVFEKVTKYTEITRDQADTILESIRRRRRAAILETQVQGGAMIRRKVTTVTVEKAEDAPTAARATTRKRRVAAREEAAAEAAAAEAAEAVSNEAVAAVEKTEESTAEETRPRTSARHAKTVEEPTQAVEPETETEASSPVQENLPESQVPVAADPPAEPAPAVEEPPVAGEIAPQVDAIVSPEPVVAPQPEATPAVPEAPAAPTTAPAAVEPPAAAAPAEDEAKPASKRFLPSSARPEASASPIEKPAAPARPGAARPGGVAVGPKEEKKLGPTGRFIVLPSPSNRSATRVDGAAKPGETGTAPKPADSRVSYKEKRQEEELLRKTGYMRHKKSDSVRPALPPEGKRKIKVDEFISVSELAKQMGLKGTELMKKLLSLGQMVTINSTLDFDTATIVASEWGYEIENVAFQEEKFFSEDETTDEGREKRPPIVTIMGHVDHGKTSLLDAIRKSDIASKESGGITQHIGAYKVKTKEGEIVFIDTPGHEAFSAMRARGASVTDLVVLVVAADDGVMPQTEEAINHCKVANVPMLVAITKVDKHNANPQMVREKLTAYGLVDEQWGGDAIIVEVSAVTKQGVDTLLEMLLLQADMLELSANPAAPARAVVLEAELDRAKGPVVNLLVIDGSLSLGDHVVCGLSGGKIRALTDDRGRQLKSVGPASPVEVTGFDAVPVPGDDCRTVPDEKAAKRILDRRRDEAKTKDLARKSQAKGMDAIRQAIARGEQKHLNVILKTDVQGTMEAIRDALVKLSTEIVKVNVVHCGVGGINESDINLALTAEGVVMGFRVRPDSKARHRADQENVPVHQYNVIYDMIDEVRDIMRGMLPKEKKEQQVGRIEIRQVFSIPKIGTVAGSYVVEGKVTRSSLVRVFHDNIQVFEGRLASLRRFKDDVKEVATGYECGISIEGFNDIREGDTLEIYEIVETQMEL
ncbi:MAG: translation initiation factor IF-2 [Deltaproteobacteria bacterium HGW-Deltaproteobacteria-17]|nr:MAG: translation initiation factor IF-2 [Deltaproteobacteria bacterium HGW-Deltaproteobacteria-17]